MADDSVDLVERFVHLAWVRRQRALTDPESADIDRLIVDLTQRIEGLRSPGERRRRGTIDPLAAAASSPEASSSRPNSVAGSAPSRPVSAAGSSRPRPASAAEPSVSAAQVPVQARPRTSAPKATAGGLAQEAPITGLGANAYTPRSSLPFLGDYFGDLEDAVAPSPLQATRIVDADGTPVEPVGDELFLLTREALDRAKGNAAPSPRVDEEPALPAEADGPSENRSCGSHSSAGVASTGAGKGTGTGADAGTGGGTTGGSQPTGTGTNSSRSAVPQAIVHLRAGGNVRGEIRRFKPQEGQVEVHTRSGPHATPVHEILAVFLGNLRKPPPEEGQDVEVVLANDKQLRGKTRDYRPDGLGYMLVPQPRRGNVDCIWIPNGSTKSIRPKG